MTSVNEATELEQVAKAICTALGGSPKDYTEAAAAAIDALESVRQKIPDFKLFEYVHACFQWHVHNGKWTFNEYDDDEILTVGLVMREDSLLRQRGYDVKQAYAMINWPESLGVIRKEVFWEIEKYKRKDIKCEIDKYDPAKAKRSIPFVERSIRKIEKELSLNGESDDQDSLVGFRERLVFLTDVVANCTKTELA